MESPDGHVASVYWRCNQGVYVSFDDTDTCEFIKLSKRHRWVVDNSEVQIGVLVYYVNRIPMICWMNSKRLVIMK